MQKRVLLVHIHVKQTVIKVAEGETVSKKGWEEGERNRNKVK